MAKCASLQQIFDVPLPPNPTLIQSLSSLRHHIKIIPPDLSSTTEFFGELHFKDDEDDNGSPHSKASFTELFCDLYFKDPSPLALPLLQKSIHFYISDNSPSSSGTSNSGHVEGVNLQLCTEGLGSESFDVESVHDDDDDDDIKKEVSVKRHEGKFRSSLRNNKTFPPPISSIGGNGKPWVYFKSFRRDGRFVLSQFRIPTQMFFNAYREDGCLRLHPVRPVKKSRTTEDIDVKMERKKPDVHEL